MERSLRDFKSARGVLSVEERSYLLMGTDSPRGRLPLFDAHGQEVKQAVIKSCISKGYVERWFANPMRPQWVMFRLTDKGRQAIK